MLYRVIGIMSGSSLDGLDIAFVELEESGGKWNYTIKNAQCIQYTLEWKKKLINATSLSAFDYLLLHSEFGKWIGEQVISFIDTYQLHHQVQLIVSHGHTTFHSPQQGMTAQLGDGATIAAITEINVVSDLRALDVAFGGQGAPIVPIGEKLLFSEYPFCLNLGGIANLSLKTENGYFAFDVCAANRVLNLLANQVEKEYDENGSLAATGKINTQLLTKLNALDYYNLSFPKSLSNDFGTEVVFPLINEASNHTHDKLRTYTEHIAMQIGYAIQKMESKSTDTNNTMLITGGGAFNTFLVDRIQHQIHSFGIKSIVPDEMVVQYKEALIMCIIGVLRWREEYNVLQTVTGAKRNSIGGAVWIGQEG